VRSQPVPVEIVALLVSPVHAYEGRPEDGPQPDPAQTNSTSISVQAGRGIAGDRYFNRPVHRKASVTVFDAQALDELAESLGLSEPLDPLLTRRNISIRGFPIDELAARRAPDGTRTDGAIFSLDSGAGAIRFQAHRPASPCAWMDVVLVPGAFRGLRGRGGVRCEPLDTGELRLGAALLTVFR
jgi:MOSC domain-containing protein YiiM